MNEWVQLRQTDISYEQFKQLLKTLLFECEIVTHCGKGKGGYTPAGA